MQETQETRVLSLRKIPWRRKWQHIPLFLPCLKNPMDRGTWCATVHGVTESRTRLSNSTQRKIPRPHWRPLVWTGPGHTGRHQGSVHTAQQDEAVCVLHPCQLDKILFSLNFTLWWVNVLIYKCTLLMMFATFYPLFTDHFCFPFGEFLIHVTCILISISHLFIRRFFID